MLLGRNSQIKKTRVLALASAGGHWQQLMELRDALRGCDILFATTLHGLAEQYAASPSIVLPDCNRNSRRKTCMFVFLVVFQLLRFRPHVVISTGALPGRPSARLFLVRTERPATDLCFPDEVACLRQRTSGSAHGRRIPAVHYADPSERVRAISRATPPRDRARHAAARSRPYSLVTRISDAFR